MKYRKRPVVIEAWKVDASNMTDMLRLEQRNWSHVTVFIPFVPVDGHSVWVEIKTPEGTMRANDGDYIIKGVAGELYPCKPDIFEQTYDKIED